MTEHPSVHPPIGGADLECLLACEELPITTLPAVIAICGKHGFRLVETDALLAYGADAIEPQQVSQAPNLSEFVVEAERCGARRCIANLCGKLIETRTSLSVLFDVENKVAVVSVPEDVLWGFRDDPSRADFETLRAFSDCCQEIASELSSTIGYLGPEALHPADMALEGVEGHGEGHGACRIDDGLFSERRLRDLFDWYRAEYVKRWDKG